MDIKVGDGPPTGLCLVVGPNKSSESPGSHVMMQFVTGASEGARVEQTLYMHEHTSSGDIETRCTSINLDPWPRTS